jgi:hypothetical protein
MLLFPLRFLPTASRSQPPRWSTPAPPRRSLTSRSLNTTPSVSGSRTSRETSKWLMDVPSLPASSPTRLSPSSSRSALMPSPSSSMSRALAIIRSSLACRGSNSTIPRSVGPTTALSLTPTIAVRIASSDLPQCSRCRVTRCFPFRQRSFLGRSRPRHVPTFLGRSRPRHVPAMPRLSRSSAPLPFGARSSRASSSASPWQVCQRAQLHSPRSLPIDPQSRLS